MATSQPTCLLQCDKVTTHQPNYNEMGTSKPPCDETGTSKPPGGEMSTSDPCSCEMGSTEATNRDVDPATMPRRYCKPRGVLKVRLAVCHFLMKSRFLQYILSNRAVSTLLL